MKGTSVTMGTSTSKKAELGKIERMRDAYVPGTTELKLFKKSIFENNKITAEAVC